MSRAEFILMSSGRKGTFLALTALACHPRVWVHEQVLNDALFYPNATGAQVLERIFGQTPPYARATILPLAWASARPGNPPEYPGLWDELRARRVSVIHLHRRNMLRWHLSFLVAQQAGVWITCKEPDYPRSPVFVDERECRRRILLDWREERHARRFFARHRCVDLWYEDLISDFDGQMDSVQRFLRLAPRKLRPTCVKQENRPLTQAIANYEQLRTAWSGTRWEAFLQDSMEPGVGLANYEQLRAAWSGTRWEVLLGGRAEPGASMSG